MSFFVKIVGSRWREEFVSASPILTWLKRMLDLMASLDMECPPSFGIVFPRARLQNKT